MGNIIHKVNVPNYINVKAMAKIEETQFEAEAPNFLNQKLIKSSVWTRQDSTLLCVRIAGQS